MVDCFTDWPDIVYMGSNTTTPRLIAALKVSFCQSGAPDIVWSDQGPQLTSKLFRDFAKEWGFKHVMSTPTYPQSNGKVEAMVKSMKKLFEASWVRSSLDEGRLARALLQYWNTPSWRDNLSPAQKLFGCPIQDMLPAHHRAFAPEWQRSAEEMEAAAASHLAYSNNYNCGLHFARGLCGQCLMSRVPYLAQRLIIITCTCLSSLNSLKSIVVEILATTSPI